MAIVGFSTPYRVNQKTPFPEIVKGLLEMGVDTIEIAFSNKEGMKDFKLTPELISDLKKFKRLSIHAPEIKGIEKEKEAIDILRSLCGQLPIEGIAIHPNIVEDFKLLEDSGLPFLIENMDSRKPWGTHPEQFKNIIENHKFGFILDVQHTYEHDPSMNLAREFIKLFGDRLKHMHVSGQMPGEVHYPAHIAENKDAITQILKESPSVPKILEGYAMDVIPDTAKAELAFVKSFEK